MDDGMRVGLRALVRRAEWAAPTSGQKDAEARARRLREVGQELAGRVAAVEDRDTWAHRATIELAAHCERAAASWSADDVDELDRLRAAALIALAPAPGESDQTDDQRSLTSARSAGRLSLAALPGGRRTAVIGLSVIACAAVVGIVVAGVSGGGRHGGTVEALPTLTASQESVGLSSSAASPSATGTAAGSAPTASQTPGSASAAASTSASASASATAANTARVTAIEMTATPADGYPEVQIYGTITASGTGEVTYTITVAGSSGSPQASTEDESGQTSYALSQTLYLQPWCGRKSVTVTVSSGSVSRSSTVPVAGC